MRKRLFLVLIFLLLCAARGLAEETLVPDAFTCSGGTGRVTLSCPEVRLTEDGATAVITISSPRYVYIKVDGVEYPTTCDENSATAVIPAQINRSFDILAMTTAMSAPHEIRYSLYIRVDALADSAIPGLKWQSALNTAYAEGFTVDYYEGGYALIDVKDGGRYLVVPEDMPVPDTLPPEITALRQPLEHIYLAATSAMSLFDALDAVDSLRFSSLRQEDWYVAGAAEAMERGDLLFAGKYDTPDYELLVREGCGLAIESTMITHAPKIQELLELLGIPVFVDRSSYESHPLGRTEWIKVYAVMLGREAEAEAFFAAQTERVADLRDFENTGKTVAFFYINTNGAVVARNPADYIPAMIEMAGGRYALENLSALDISGASVTVSMEDFYAMAADADYVIYNAAIDAPIATVQELVEKNALMADLKAVREGRVWCADRRLYQATDALTDLILDIHHMLLEDGADMTFLTKVQ